MALTLITQKWAPCALEYAKFLNSFGLNPISVISGNSRYGYIISVFADEEEYLNISLYNEHFNNTEKQINELLNIIESLSVALFYKSDYLDNYDKDDDHEELDDEIEQKGESYFG